MIRYIVLSSELNIKELIHKQTVVKNQKDIENIICHIDLEKINNYTQLTLKDLLKQVWNHFVAYHIFNVNQKDFVEMYEDIAEDLIGKIRLIHPVNDKSTTFGKSRDIKPNPDFIIILQQIQDNLYIPITHIINTMIVLIGFALLHVSLRIWWRNPTTFK